MTPFTELRSAGRGLNRKDREFTFGTVEFGVSLKYVQGLCRVFVRCYPNGYRN